MFIPTAPGNLQDDNSRYMIDYSKANEGYIYVKNKTGNEKRMKARISKDDGIFQNYEVTYNREVFIPLIQGDGKYTVKIYLQVSGTAYRQIGNVRFAAKIDPSYSPYLFPNTYSWFTQESMCYEISNNLCKTARNQIEKASAIYNFVITNIKYDRSFANDVKKGKVDGWWLPDPDKVLKDGKSICFGYSSLVAALLRAQRIPCSVEVGPVASAGLHAWNRVLVNMTGNITPDLILEKDKWFRMDATFAASGMKGKQLAEFLADDTNYGYQYRG